MLSGVKFIPCAELNLVSDVEEDSKLHSSRKERKKSRSKREKHRTKNKRVHHDSSDEGTEKLKKRSNRKKWYSSDASSLSLSQTESESFSEHDEGGHRKPKMNTKGKNKREVKENESFGDEGRGNLKEKMKRRKKHKSSEDSLSSDVGKEDRRRGRKHKRSHSRKHSGVKALEEKDSSGSFILYYMCVCVCVCGSFGGVVFDV